MKGFLVRDIFWRSEGLHSAIITMFSVDRNLFSNIHKFTDFRRSRGLINHDDSVLELSNYVVACDVADISEAKAASIFMIEVCCVAAPCWRQWCCWRFGGIYSLHFQGQYQYQQFAYKDKFWCFIKSKSLWRWYISTNINVSGHYPLSCFIQNTGLFIF
jgi:hypothetical protein